MDSFAYENQGTTTYLVYKIGDADSVDSMSLGMITNNQITGLAPTVYTQLDTNRYIKYNVSAKISVKQFFSGSVNKRRLLGVFNGIVAAMLSAEDYMIEDSMILLDTDYIFADVSTCETVLICLPIQSEIERTDLGAFFKNIMFNTQFDQTENCDYVAKIINHLNSTPVFSLLQFKAVLDELNGHAAVHSVQPSAMSAPQPEQVQTVVKSNIYQTPPAELKRQPTISTVQTVVSQLAISQQPVPSASEDPPVAKIRSNVPLVAKQTENLQSTSDKKDISLFYLLQHYNSENAAAYKAQKAAQKSGGSTIATSTAPSKKKDKNSGKKKNQTPTAGVHFAIPGQASTINAPVQSPVKPISAQPVKPVQPVAPIQQPVVKTPVTPQPAVKQPVSITKQQSPFVSSPPQPIQGVNFGETTVLNGGIAGETTVLSASTPTARQINPYLIRAKNNERIPVNKPVFRIGKEKSYVDYFIGDNSAISRSHANIISRDGKYFVMDTNSTNHTYLDGSILQSNSEYEILHGSKIRFANEDFEFKLY